MSFGQTRSVSVVLKASVSSYVGKIAVASKATSDFSKATLAHAGKNKQAWDQVGKGMLFTGVALAAGIGLAVKAFADFDKEMSTVRAVSGATAGEMDKLRVAAIKAGADTVFSAAEAAKAQGELAKVGISTSDILGGALTGSLNLAAAGTLELARAAEISGQAMKIFKLGGEDVGRIADALASGANKSAADVEQLAQALSQGGLMAAQAGLDLEDTVGALSAFADNALIGSDAGTSFKAMLQRLTPQSGKAADSMKSLGLSAYDTAGNFIGIDKFAGKLKDGLKDLTAEQRNAQMAIIFGSDAVRAATILYDLGEQGLRSYIDGVTDQGAAARVAAIQMDNLTGDLEQLRGSIETALIQAGSGANDSLRALTQTLTGFVNFIGALPAPLQQVGIGIVGIGAAGLLIGGTLLTVIPKIAATKDAMVALGIASKMTKANLVAFATGPIGVALAGITLAIGLFAKSQIEAAGRADDLRSSLDQVTGAMTDQTKAIAAKQLQEADAFKSARELGISLEEVNKAALGNKESMDALREGAKLMAEQHHRDVIAIDEERMAHGRLDQGLGDTAAKSQDLMNKYRLLVNSVGEVNATLNPQIVAVKEISEATGAATGRVKTFAGTQEELKKKADDAKSSLDALLKSIEGYGSNVLGARGAARDYEAAIDAATKSLKDNGKTLDVHTEKGRSNQQALESVATSTLKSVTANYQNGASVKALDKQVTAGRKAFIDQATDMGLSKTAAGKLADALGLTKANVDKLNSVEAKPKVTADTAKATFDLSNVGRRLDYLDGRVATATVNVVTSFSKGLEGYAGKAADNVLHPASGGYITGAGTATSDSIPAMLSNKEYVVNAAAVSKYGVGFFHELNRMRFASGGYVGGGSGSSVNNRNYDQPVNIAHATFMDGRDLRAEAAERRQKALRQT